MMEPGLEWVPEHLTWLLNERRLDERSESSEAKVHQYLQSTDEAQRRELLLTANRAYVAASRTNETIRVVVQEGPPAWLDDDYRDAVERVYSTYQALAVGDTSEARAISQSVGQTVGATQLALIHILDGLVVTQDRYNVGPDWSWDYQAAPVASVEQRSDPRTDPEEAFLDGMVQQEVGNLDGAKRAWTVAADQGHPQATFNLGRLASKAGDVQEATRRYQDAAQAGWPKAMFNLGVIARDGGDDQRAQSWFQQAAEAGETAATTSLGEMSKDAGDLGEARRLFELAASQGDTSAMFRLGRMAIAAGDTRTAKRRYEEAATAGNDDAMFGLSILADQAGDGAMERHWLEQASDSGNSDAMVNLAVCEIQSDNVGVAQALLQRAAALGNAHATEFLRTL